MIVKDADNVGALPATGPFVDRLIRIFRDKPYDDTSALVLHDYGELCRAAPAGGECQHEWAEDGDATAGRLFCRLCKIDKPASAPAGSGEVDEEMLAALEMMASVAMSDGMNYEASQLRTAAAFLRKLQQGARL